MTVKFKIHFLISLCLGALPLIVDSASAHRVNVFAWVEGDTIYVESKFSGGKKVKNGKVVVVDPQGVELLADLTNAEGQYSFKIPKLSDLRIMVIAGQGHQGEWTIRATELQGLPSRPPTQTGTAEAVQSEQKKAVSEKSADPATLASGTGLKPEEIKAIIETVLDRKLKPITTMLADIRQEGPAGSDIIAGIGYILGLVGIAAYVHSRKKKE